MLVRPPGISDDDVRAALAEGWGLSPRTIEYTAVGFGSHHWLTESHFVTVDEADDHDDLEGALAELDEPWETGPYGDRCRDLLRGAADAVRAALAEHDAMAAAVPRDGWVVTHGEPHRGNVFRTTDGWKVVDWDTVLLAPPERDWWDLCGGAHGDPVRNDLYTLRWDLLEVVCYVSEYWDDHDDDANARESWKNLLRYLGRLEARATPPG